MSSTRHKNDCEKKPQEYDRNGDPINICNEGFQDFKEKWLKRHPEDEKIADRQLRETFYDDFRLNNNITVDHYMNEIEQPIEKRIKKK
jgi:CRISPR/Cas system-associated endonuclease/helicase Cas3